MSEINLKSIFNSPCDYCCGYDDTMNKCSYFVCSIIEKEKAEKRMKKNNDRSFQRNIEGEKKRI